MAIEIHPSYAEAPVKELKRAAISAIHAGKLSFRPVAPPRGDPSAVRRKLEVESASCLSLTDGIEFPSDKLCSFIIRHSLFIVSEYFSFGDKPQPTELPQTDKRLLCVPCVFAVQGIPRS